MSFRNRNRSVEVSESSVAQGLIQGEIEGPFLHGDQLVDGIARLRLLFGAEILALIAVQIKKPRMQVFLGERFQPVDGIQDKPDSGALH